MIDTELAIPLYIIKIGDTGISWIDLLLVILCPLGGLLGALVGSIMQHKKINRAIAEDFYLENRLQASVYQVQDQDAKAVGPYLEYTQLLQNEYRNATWGNFVIGIALGIVVSLYFFGAITQDITSLTRVVGICILLGYQAPNLWKVQEKVISDVVQSKLVGNNQDLNKNH